VISGSARTSLGASGLVHAAAPRPLPVTSLKALCRGGKDTLGVCFIVDMLERAERLEAELREAPQPPGRKMFGR